jgi:hypothetical protein
MNLQLNLCWLGEGWKNMESADKESWSVGLKLRDGTEVVGHWACDSSGEIQPPFAGWFVKVDKGYDEVFPIAWRPV